MRYTNLFPVVIVSIRHDLPSDMSSIFFDLFWNVTSLRLDKGFRLFNFPQTSSWIWITKCDFLLSLPNGMVSWNVLSRWTQLVYSVFGRISTIVYRLWKIRHFSLCSLCTGVSCAWLFRFSSFAGRSSLTVSSPALTKRTWVSIILLWVIIDLHFSKVQMFLSTSRLRPSLTCCATSSKLASLSMLSFS